MKEKRNIPDLLDEVENIPDGYIEAIYNKSPWRAIALMVGSAVGGLAIIWFIFLGR